jgi:hypothetical protein
MDDVHVHAEFTVTHSSKLIKCPSVVTIQRAPAQPEQQANKLRLDLNPIGMGIYPDRLILSSSTDTRVIDVEVDVRLFSQTHMLTACVEAWQEVVQNIPVVNSTEKALAVVATVRDSLLIRCTPAAAAGH